MYKAKADDRWYSHGVGSPQNERKQSQRSEELRDLVSAGLDGVGAVQGDVPDDEDVGNASDGIPAPLLSCLLVAVGRKETGQNHDQVSDDSHDGVGTVNAGQETKVGQQERGGNGPVDVPGEVDLTTDVVVSVGNLVVV